MSGLSTILRVTGWSLIIMAAALFPSMLVDMVARQQEWHVFGLIILVQGFVGLAMVLTVGGRQTIIDTRIVLSALLISALALSTAATLPFVFGAGHTGLADAMFEGVARFTTTGGTVFRHPSDLPPGLALWRGVVQWLGGGWTLALGIAVLPYLRVGGMGFYRVDAFAVLEPTRRAKRLAVGLGALYMGLTWILALLLWLAGMSNMDAIIHAMGVVSSGGAATWENGLDHYHQASIDLIVAFGMLLAGLPFPVLLAALRGNLRMLMADTQVKWYLGVMALALAVLMLWDMGHGNGTWGSNIHDDGMTVIASLTGSGYAAHPALVGLGLPAVILLFLTTWGGCAGSTTGGLKVFRIRAMLMEIWIQLGALLRPHTIRTVKVDNKTLDTATRRHIMGFVFVYTVAFAALAWGLGAVGLDEVTALSAAVSAIANAQLGLGSVLGQTGGYAALPDSAKILLVIGMVLGRLEILPVLALFTSAFWRR